AKIFLSRSVSPPKLAMKNLSTITLKNSKNLNKFCRVSATEFILSKAKDLLVSSKDSQADGTFGCRRLLLLLLFLFPAGSAQANCPDFLLSALRSAQTYVHDVKETCGRRLLFVPVSKE